MLYTLFEIEWTNMELEKTVRMMERNVIAMESGNHETDDSDAKQKYEGQKQLNIQLMEQKRWAKYQPVVHVKYS